MTKVSWAPGQDRNVSWGAGGCLMRFLAAPPFLSTDPAGMGGAQAGVGFA